MTTLRAVLFAVGCALCAAGAAAQPYAVDWRTVDGGGHAPITGGTYSLHGTTGQPDASVPHTGGGFAVAGGYWADGVGAMLPVLGLASATNVTSAAADLHGSVTDDGGAAILSRGFVFAAQATNADPQPGGTGVTLVTVSGTTGTMTATLASLAAGTTYSFRAYATNAVGTGYSALATFTTGSASGCPGITLASLPDGVAGAPYTGSAAAAGGTAPYTYAVTSGSVPAGLALTQGGTGAGGVAGTPSAAGTFAFAITATDANGCTGTRSYGVVIGSVVAAGDLVIREFRSRGPAGAHDEYVEITNRSSEALTLLAIDGSPGLAIAASSTGSCPGGAPALLATIPNGTVIAPGGSFLAANDTPATGYSLSDYGGIGLATPDATWTDDLCDDGGIGLFSSTGTFDESTRLDAVGFSGSADLYREGAGLSPADGITADGEWAFLRRAPYPTGLLKDTGDNAADFRFASTNAAAYGGVQSVLGSPGPGNLASGRIVTLPVSLADPAVGVNAAPNRVQSGNYYYFRRKITNDTGAAITRLRYRILDLTTLYGGGYNPGVQADWRGIATPDVVITLPDATTVSAKGLTLEAPTIPYPTFQKGGGYNASFVVDLTDLGGALANGASLYVNVGFRNVGSGNFYFVVLPEVLN